MKVLKELCFSVFTKEKVGVTKEVNSMQKGLPLWFSEKEVQSRLEKLNLNKSPVPRGVHPQVFRKLGLVTSRQLFLI